MAPFWTTLDTILTAFALLGAPFGASWVPQALQKSKKERKTEVQNRPGRSEGPKEGQRRPRTSKMDPKGLKNRPQMKKKIGRRRAHFTEKYRVDRSPSSDNFTQQTRELYKRNKMFFITLFRVLLVLCYLLSLYSSCESQQHPVTKGAGGSGRSPLNLV